MVRMSFSLMAFHSAQVISPNRSPDTVGSLNNSYMATTGSLAYRLETANQKALVSCSVVMYILFWNFSSFRFPMECQSMIRYSFSDLAHSTAWSISFRYSSWPLSLQAAG